MDTLSGALYTFLKIRKAVEEERVKQEKDKLKDGSIDVEFEVIYEEDETR